MLDQEALRNYDKETLIGMLLDAAKNWLAHDGLWFQAVEHHFGLDAAIQLDAEAWEHFSAIEARRILQRHDIETNGGLETLEKALGLRLYAYLNEQSTTWIDEHTLRFEMNDCRVQSARKRKNLPDFPCKQVGIVEYTSFAQTIDPRIQTKCISCPPDPHPETYYCAWEFTLSLETE